MDMFLNESMDFVLSIEYEPHIFENISVRVGLILVYSFIFILCFLGNLAVILVVSLRWKRQSVSKFCLGNMAVANFSVSVFCVLQNLTLFLVDTAMLGFSWIFGELMCKMYHFITNLCHTASILMVVVISMERYLVLLHPRTCRQFLTTWTLVLIVLGVWILSAVISLPNLFYFGIIPIQPKRNGDFGHVCVQIYSMYYSTVVDTMNFIILYLIPLTIMLALYLRIGFFLIRRESLGRDLYEETARGQDALPGSGLPRRCQKQLHGLNVEEKRTVPEVHWHSAPAHLGSVSMPLDAPTSREGFRGQILSQLQENLKSRLNMKGSGKWGSHPAHTLHFGPIKAPGLPWNGLLRRYSSGQELKLLENFCEPHLIQDETLVGVKISSCEVMSYVSGGMMADDRPSQSTTTILQRRTIVAINPEAQRLLYRYNRLELTHVRCKQSQRVVRMFFFVVITFALLNLPHHLHKLCIHFLPSHDINNQANNLVTSITFALMYANCAVNPILYAFMSKSYRATLREFRFGSRRKIVAV